MEIRGEFLLFILDGLLEIKCINDDDLPSCYISTTGTEVWKTFCMSEQRALFAPRRRQLKAGVFQIVKADRVLSAELILALWHAPSSHRTFAFSFNTFILGALAFNLTDWANSRRLAISTDAHKLSVKKRLFNNIAFTADAQGPVGHYRAITSEILVRTSGGKLMCCCDESFSLGG